MALQLKCPGCGHTFSVGEELAGSQTRCNSCHGPVDVPSRLLPIHVVGGERGLWERPKEKEPPPPPSTFVLLVAIAASLLLLVLIGGLAVLVLL